MTFLGQGEYERHLRSRGLRPATVDAYTGWPRRLQSWADKPLPDLDTADLEEWIGSHTWKPNTHQKAVQAIMYYYHWLADTGRIGADPAVTLRPARSPAPVPSPCSEERYRLALKRATGDTYWRLRLAGETGLRRAELAAVRSDDVAQLVTGPSLIVDGKGGKKRWVPLPEDLAAWLRLQHGYVFGNGHGGHIDPHGVGAWYSRHLGVKAHSLRHRYATLAYHSGHDINAVRDLLGHSSVTTTQAYVKVGGEDLREAAKGAWEEAS